MSHDFNIGVISVVFDGNELNGNSAKHRFTAILRSSRKLKEVSLRRCMLEDDGLHAVFAEFTPLQGLKKLDLSENGITDRGLDSIDEFIGAHKKTQLKSINLSYNAITTPSLIKFLKAIEARNNTIKELNFSFNNLQNDAA